MGTLGRRRGLLRSTWSRGGNNAPYKYDLRRFNAIGSISHDHRSVDFPGAALADRVARRR
jgi:hypothetical protein